ncbi:Protein Skeletor, isoforms B/C [Nymphon striatum]|nr:Protein Skeletor, isoforms B/C [Nymphon striatum]
MKINCEDRKERLQLRNINERVVYCQRSEPGEYIGSFKNLVHGIAGDIYALDNKRLFIKGFSYDGTGPDAFFWGGTTTEPDGNGIIIRDERNSLDVLQPYRNRDITITLPEGLTVSNLKWISVWCRKFGVDFGHLILPDNINIPSAPAAPATRVDPVAPPLTQRASSVQSVGPLVTFDHGVSGDVVFFDDQTIVINKFKYDGRGPAAYFWADYGDQLTPQGQLLGSSLTVNAGDALPRASGNQMVIVNIPEGRTVHDYTVFGVWCEEAAVSYGEVLLPISSATAPETKQTKEKKKLNCEILDNDSAYEVRWALTDDEVVMQLVGKIDDGHYMSFGLSGDETSSLMAGGDVVVAWLDGNGNGHAEDYHLKSKEACTNTRGACPDTTFGAANDIELLNGAVVNGFHMVTVRRPLFKKDDDADENIYVDGPQAVIWAIGKMNSDDLVTYHFNKRNKETKMIDFARTPKWNCPQPSEASEPARKPNIPVQRQTVQRQTEKPKQAIVPWDIPEIKCPRSRKLRARIGPSGGRKGYEAITGEVGWGIAWYVNGNLLPEITLQRGRTYIFEVEGGKNKNNKAKTHPFYITSSPVGGYASNTEEEQEDETIYAGAKYNRRTRKYEPTASGRLCEYELTGDKRAEDYATFKDFKEDLRIKCERGRHATLRWKPTDKTPDTVYYQCYTHRRLGYKINIVDSCDDHQAAASFQSSKNVSKPQSVEEKVVTAVKVPSKTVYNSKPAQLPQLPRPIVRARPTEASENKGYPNPIVVEEVVKNPESKSKPPKRTIYVPVKIVPEDELPENIPIHDGSDKQFVFGNPIAVPLGVRPNAKPKSTQNEYSYQSGFRPLILRDQSSITQPLKNKFHNRPTHLVGSESIGQSFKAPKPENGFKVARPAKQPVHQSVKNKDKTVYKKKPEAQNLNIPSFEPQKINQKVKHQQQRPQYQEGQNRPQYQEGQKRPQYQEGQKRPQYQEGQKRPQYQEGQPRPPHQEGQHRPQYQEGQKRPQYQEGQQRPQYEEGQQRPQYEEGQQRPQYEEGQQRPQPQYPEGQQRPQYQEGQPRPQHQDGQSRPQHQDGQSRPQHQGGQQRPQHQGDQPQSQYQGQSRPQYQGSQVRPQPHDDQHRPQPQFDQHRPEFHEGQHGPQSNERPHGYGQESRPRPHLPEDQRRPDFRQKDQHARPQPHNVPVNGYRRPQQPHQGHQRPQFKNHPSQSHVGQPHANYKQVFNLPSRPQGSDRPFKEVSSTVNRPTRVESHRPVYPQSPQQLQLNTAGQRQNTENRPQKFNYQGPKNSSEYAVLTHVMEYISQGQHQPNFSHKINKREAGSAEPEPKSEPEPPKGKEDKKMDDKAQTQSSKDKNNAITISFSLFTVVAVALTTLFV